jgi:integrase
MVRAQKAPTTIRNSFFLLQKVLKEQVVRRRITGNPCAAVQLPQVNKPRDDDDDDRHYLTPREVDALAAALPAPYDLLVQLAAYTGLRAGEIAGLQERDIDLHDGVAHVRRSVIDVTGGLQYDTPKTRHSRRAVPLDDKLLEDLTAYLREHRAAAAQWFVDHPDAQPPGNRLPVFVGSARGGRTTGTVRLDYRKLHDHAQWYSTHWARALKAAQLHPSVRFHDLRHTCASWLVQDGVGYKEVQEQLGHASVMITIDRYSHLDRGVTRERVRAAMAQRRAGAAGDSNVVRIRRSS